MFTKQRFFNPALIIMIACLTTFFVVNAIGQDVKTTLFQDANKSLSAAREAHADVLAPKNFSKQKLMQFHWRCQNRVPCS